MNRRIQSFMSNLIGYYKDKRSFISFNFASEVFPILASHKSARMGGGGGGLIDLPPMILSLYNFSSKLHQNRVISPIKKAFIPFKLIFILFSFSLIHRRVSYGQFPLFNYQKSFSFKSHQKR